MTDTEKILEFDRIKEKLAELACTEKAGHGTTGS